MFKKLVNATQTDNFIATLIPRLSFQIAYTEEEMSADHDKAYYNFTSPPRSGNTNEPIVYRQFGQL